jgi:hypothetical protein
MSQSVVIVRSATASKRTFGKKRDVIGSSSGVS